MSRFACRLLVLSLVLAVPSASAQVFKWVDEDGRVHYGEKPPPGTKANTVKPPAAVPGTPAEPRDLQSQELDFRGRQIKKSQDEAREAQEAANRAAYCNHAKQQLTIAEQAALYRSEKGERVFLSDDQQKAEVESRRAAVARYCR